MNSEPIFAEYRPLDVENFNKLAEDLLDANKKLTAAQKLQRKQFEEYLCTEFSEICEEECYNITDSDDEIEFTEVISSPEASPKDAPSSLADANNNNQPVTNPEQTAGGKAPSCPLVVRESLPASVVFNSGPLPANLDEMPNIKLPKDVHHANSIEEGYSMLQWIIIPVKMDAFIIDYWEKNACLVLRKNPSFFSKLISFQRIDQMLIENHMDFTTNIDVTRYKDGKRETLNPEGRAKPPTVWNFYDEGCSIRILNPSTYLPELRNVCSVLQEYFHCLVGANVCLTPPNSQGIAPHFDDIEAFVLQIEGRQRWRLYMPLQQADVLSGNYSQEQLGEPILDEVLEAGDVLYFPHGTVHQAVTDKDQHSLHITLSVYKQQTFANLLERLLPHVLQRAVKESLILGLGLPLHTWQNLGFVHGMKNNSAREDLMDNVNEMLQKCLVATKTEIDWAVDQLAIKFHHEALPPSILPEERMRTVFGSHNDRDEKGYSIRDYKFTDQTAIRLLRANILRLVINEGSMRIYYYVDNSTEFCKYQPNFLEIKPDEAAAVLTLSQNYPAYIQVSQLPLSADRRIEVAKAFWERGLLIAEKPFEINKKD